MNSFRAENGLTGVIFAELDWLCYEANWYAPICPREAGMAPRDPETDPAAFLGRELKRARQAAGFSSQDALAAQLGFDRSVVTKAETGDRPPTDDVLYAWCSATGLDSEHYGRLALLARRSDGAVPGWFEGWLEAERAAQELRIWSPILVPGLLQTADYARAIFLTEEDDEDKVSKLVDARLERQAILDRPGPPHLITVLDELVLHRLIGSPTIVADQLGHLVTVGERRNISVHVLPATDANAGLGGAFDIASTDGAPDTLRMEGSVEDQTTPNPAIVRKASVVFDLVRRDALPRVQSRALILEAIEQWKTKA
jgi:transcriptional regulator with XRE-family HTH domain